MSLDGALDRNIVRYNATRNIAAQAFPSACYAPYANLYFDQWGKVKACCWSDKFDVGDIARETIDEIWRGPRLELLRSALKANRFDLGCHLCAEQLNRGWFASTNMRNFDRYAIRHPAPEWPTRIELSISNSCNLQCIMCNGDFSTAIRTHRERKSARPKIYPENFVAQLMPYLPHLRVIKFLGGEPFLISEYFEIWERMAVEAPNTPCHVTTNGTVFNKRVESVISTLRFAFAISVDGATKETAESIRTGLDFNEQMSFVKRMRAYTKGRNTHLSLVYCFMRKNWHELGAFCALCDRLDCDAHVNTVNYPPEFAVYNLPQEELLEIRHLMQEQAPSLARTLTKNRRIWFEEFDRVTAICLANQVHAGLS